MAPEGGGGLYSAGTTTITNSTIAYNRVASGVTGGGLDVAGGTAGLNNTIVALNSQGTTGPTASDISLSGGALTSTCASNLIGTGGSGGLVNGESGNQVGVASPGLGTLGSAGGSTQTISLLTGSPAIDAGNSALAVDSTGQPLAYDQRGVEFARIVGNSVDVGAYEYDSGFFLVVTTQPPASVTAGSDFGLTVTAKDNSGAVDSSFKGTVSMALLNNPGGATLGGTLTVTAQNGVTTFSGLTLDKAAAGYTLVVSANGLGETSASTLSVTAAAASQLTVTAHPPGIVGAGSAFDLVVAAEDPFGNVDPTFGGSVTVSFSNNPGGATLGGTLTAAAQSGVATFTGLTLDQPGTGYTLQASTPGLTTACTAALNVNASNVPTLYTVDLTSATGMGSGNAGDLVYVIGLANANANPGGSEIEFDPTVFASPQTITLNSTLVLAETAGPVIIDGPGAGLVTISGKDAVEVLSVSSDVTANLSGVTIARGSASVGGGLYNSGTMTIADATMTDNWASSSVFLGGLGGGLYNAGVMTITDSTFANNWTARENLGGGLYNAGTMTVSDSTFDHNWAWYGGGIGNDGTMTVTGCTVTDNWGRSDGGVTNDRGGTMTLTNSTIANNSVQNQGGGFTSSGKMVIANCTIAGNLAPWGGGGLDAYIGTTMITNSTIADNDVASGLTGGGLFVQSGTAVLNNTIVALNTSDATTPTDIYIAPGYGGAVSSTSAYNLIGSGGSGGLVNGQNGNQVGVANPGLDPNGLQNNGGPTRTIALLQGSPAIDAGSNALAVDAQGNGLPTDQRGPGFPRIVGGTVDVGAYEFKPTPTISVTDAGGTYTGLPYRATPSPSVIEGVPVTLDYQQIGVDLGPNAPSNAGTYQVTANFAGSADYRATSTQPVTFTIDRAPLIVTANSGTKLYGASLPALTVSYSGFVSGESPANLATLPTMSTTATASSHVLASGYPITASGAIDPNYTITYVPGTLTVTPAPLVIPANNAAKVYGAAMPALTASYRGFVNGDSTARLSPGPALVTTASASSPVVPGGYAIVAMGASDPDYAISSQPGTLLITPATLTITANNASMVQGTAVPLLLASYAGLVNGDSPSSLTTLPTLTTPATVASPPGTYLIVVGGARSLNYAIEYSNGILVVTPAPVKVLKVSVQMVRLGKTKKLTQVIELQFTGALVPGSAESTHSYSLTTIPASKRQRSQTVMLSQARYSIATNTVTLITHRPLVLNPPLKLTYGLFDTYGRPVGGVATLSKKRITF
jgi:hypothetical protein